MVDKTGGAMARKRMFDSEIIGQDSFIDLPMDAKALYFLLGMEADDEGFVNYRKILKLYGGTEDSIRILAMKDFIIPFKSGVIVITDWNINNYLDKNRVTKTIYQKEKKELIFNQITKKYEKSLNPLNSSVKHLLNNCLTSIEEYRVEENSIEEYRVDDEIVRPDNKTSSSSAPINNLPEQEYQTSELLIDDNLERPENKTTELSKSGNQERFENKTAELPSMTIFEYLETNFGRTISPREFEIINSYRDTFTLDIIKEAIDRACINNAKTIRYVMGILDSWKSKGFKKIEECRSEFCKIKKYQKTANIPEWFDKKVEKRDASVEEIREIEELLREYK